MPFLAEYSLKEEDSARKPFSFHVCTMDDDGYGNKRLTEKNRQIQKNNSTYRIDIYVYHYLFIEFHSKQREAFL